MAAFGLTCNDWLPTGLLHDVGSVGNNDRLYALRGLSIGLLLGAIVLTIWRGWIARNLGGLAVMLVSTVLSLIFLVGVDLTLSSRAIDAGRNADDINGIHEPDDLLGWRPKPGATGHHSEGEDFAVEYRIDENGFKAIPNRGIPSARIFFFGDSYTFGHGVSNEDTYANIIAREYLGDAIHVFNAGVLGYGIEQMYGRFLEMESQLHAGDLVVFAPTSQDLKRNLKDFVFPSKLIFGERLGFGDRYPYYHDGHLESVELRTPWNELKAMFFNGRWTKKIFRFLHSAFTSPSTTSQAREMIERVSAMATARGARFVLFFLPQTKERRREEYEEDISSFDFHDLMRFYPGSDDDLAALRFETNTHWNDAGHALTAAAIVQSLVTHGFISADALKREHADLVPDLR